MGKKNKGLQQQQHKQANKTNGKGKWRTHKALCSPVTNGLETAISKISWGKNNWKEKIGV